MKKLMLDVVVCLFFLAHWAPVSAAQAALDEKAVADFYRGKTVTLLVGHSAGGGFDTYARLIGRYLGKYVPGNPNVIVTNMPGAGTMISVNHMYNSVARDGTLINSFDGGIVTQQLYKTSGVKFDLNKLFYLGAPDSFLYVMAVTKQSGVTKFDEILGTNAKEVRIGAVPNIGIEHASLLIRNVLGGKVKVVSGYKGTAEIRMAMKSGEVDSVITDWGSLRVTNSPDFESGEWLIFVQLTEKPIDDLPQKNVPLIYQYTKDDEQRELFRMGIINPNQYARPYVLPPGVPAERAEALRLAFERALADEKLLAEAKKAKLGINPLSGDRIRDLISAGLSMPPKMRDKLRPILLPGG